MHLFVLREEAENPQEEHRKSTQEIDHLTFLLWESPVYDCVVLPSRDVKPN